MLGLRKRYRTGFSSVYRNSTQSEDGFCAMYSQFYIDAEFMSDSKLSKNDLKVLFVLSTHAMKKNECWPSRALISKYTNIHPNHISSSLKRLETFGYIKRRLIPGKTSHYFILKPLTEPVEGHEELPFTESVETPFTEPVETPFTEPVNQKVIRKEKKKNILPDLSSMTFKKFQKLKNRPQPSDGFEAAWEMYKHSCKQGNSMEGSKTKAWFGYLQRIFEGISEDDIRTSLDYYIARKGRTEQKLAHMSTVMMDTDLVHQLIEETKDEASRTGSIRIQGFENRFRKPLASRGD